MTIESAVVRNYRKDGKCPALPTPPSPQSAIDVLATTHGRVSEVRPRSTIEVPEDPSHDIEFIIVPAD